MTIADQKRRDRADIVVNRQRETQALAALRIEKVKTDVDRRRAEADVGPVRYLAELIGMPATDLERSVRLLTLALVAVLDPMAVALLLAAGRAQQVCDVSLTNLPRIRDTDCHSPCREMLPRLRRFA